MKSYDELKYHKGQEAIIDVLVARTGSEGRSFFRSNVAFYFSVVASNMRAKICTSDRGVIPINFYGVNLAESG